MISIKHIWSVLSFREEKIEQADASIRFFIRYPYLLSNDTLALTVLGHEVAHVWYETLKAADLIAPMIQIDSETLATICQQRGLSQDQQFEFYTNLQTIASAWAEEITCDMAAIHLFGPASLFAYERTIELSGGHNSGTVSHPDSAWRCRLMVEQLRRLGFTKDKLRRRNSKLCQDLPGCSRELVTMFDRYIEYAPTLDEVDRMLDMGFLPDVRRIVEKISTNRQTLLFSATLPPEIERLAAWVLRDPTLIEIGVRRSPAETVTHAVYPVAAEQKFDLLMALLERTNFDSVLIFCRTKQNADRVAHQLKHGKHAVAVLHSNRTQRERIEALEGFKSGKYEVMVATDIASRGLDIAGVSHVINYDVPEHPEDYVHRIGRTGRAQNVGDAFTLMSGHEVSALNAIEHFIGQKIPRLKLENFSYLYTALFEPESTAGKRRAVGGGRTHRGYSFGRRR